MQKRNVQLNFVVWVIVILLSFPNFQRIFPEQNKFCQPDIDKKCSTKGNTDGVYVSDSDTKL